MRISEIQAEYGLIEASNSFVYTCLDDPKNKLEVAYYPTEIPTAKANRNGQISFMYGKPRGDVMIYKGPNENISIQHKDVKVSWGYESQEVQCKTINP